MSEKQQQVGQSKGKDSRVLARGPEQGMQVPSTSLSLYPALFSHSQR